MNVLLSSVTPAVLALSAAPVLAQPTRALPNEVVGTWRMVAATLEEDGRTSHPYGRDPAGMLVFTSDMHFVEVLTDPGIAPFASNRRGNGTDAENRRAMAGSIGFYGTYTVDERGHFSGNRVEAATFPNWVGSQRTTRDLRLVVSGNRMSETFTRPDGGVVRAEFERIE